MKILHTADWHLGKMLHKQSLASEMKAYLEWLLKYIEKEKIDLLLVSGDIFDVANPSSKDRQTYYKFLSEVNKLQVQTIITGGNHDAVSVLNAPSELLSQMGITVIGGAKDPITDEVVLVNDQQGNLQAIVAAVPFLRDRDLRNLNEEADLDRVEAIRAGMKKHYQVLADYCAEYKGKVPIIAMGHLYAKGATISESERDIGNQSSISADIFSEVFDYVALGHIHRPQIVAKNESIRYSGSPIALSFSEKSDQKSMMLIETNKKVIEKLTTIPIPKQRSLVRYTGDYDKIMDQLAAHQPSGDLPDFIELVIKADKFSHSILMNVEELINSYKEEEAFQILKHSFDFKEKSKMVTDFYENQINIDELKPQDIFETKLKGEDALGEDQKNTLMSLFEEVLMAVEQKD
jgi:exonuclease SbcD